MRKVELQISASGPGSEEIKIIPENHETHALICIQDQTAQGSILLELGDSVQTSQIALTLNPLIRQRLHQNTNLRFLPGNTSLSPLNIDLYLGNWAEMWLIEISRTLNNHYQAFDHEKKLSFSLGNKNCDHLLIYDNDKFTYRLVGKYKSGEKVAAVFFKGTPEARLIVTLAKKVKKNCADLDFQNQQLLDLIILDENTSGLMQF